MARRSVHYAAHGQGGTAFQCFFDELGEHVGSQRVTAGTRSSRAYFKVSAPRRSTDLRKVTCRHCWLAVRELAHQWIGKAGH